MKNQKEREKLLKEIENEIINLKKSPFYKYRIENKYLPVVGQGDCFSKIMFIGEAPGKNEALTGKPFCGRSGSILDELLASISLPREEVYITSIVKDRPPENRDPTPKEIEIYAPFLMRQIEIIQPKVIATLGRFSMMFLFEQFGLIDILENIGKMHGKVFEVKAKYGKIKLAPLYHPAVAIYNQSKKGELIEDFKILKSFM